MGGERLTPQVRSQLRLFQESLLQLLHRDPLQRPSMAQFCRTCARILGEQSVADSDECTSFSLVHPEAS